MPELTREKIVESCIEGLSFPESTDFETTISNLGNIPGPLLHDAFEVLLDDPDAGLALGVARAIGLTNCVDAADLAISLVDEPGKWFSHTERASIRTEAVKTLGTLKSDTAVSSLLDLVKHTRDQELLMEAILALGTIASPIAIDPLFDAMYAWPPVALSAAGALVEIGGVKVLSGFIKALQSEEDFIRSASVWALGKIGDERAISPLLELLHDSDRMLKCDIAWALGQIGGFRARLLLLALAQNDEDLDVRREASTAVEKGAVLGKYRYDR